MKISQLFEEVLTEGVAGKHLVVIDVQPEYADAFGNMGVSLAEYINENYNEFSRVTFLYNGYDTLGMINEQEYRSWWYDNGLKEEIAYDGADFYDKGYAFFRYCMDEGIDDDSISNLIRHMLDNNVHDTRELDEHFWGEFIDKYGDDEIRELMEFSDDAIHIPDLIDELKNYHNIVICGGGVNECLKEVEIALNAMGKPYETLNNFTY